MFAPKRPNVDRTCTEWGTTETRPESVAENGAIGAEKRQLFKNILNCLHPIRRTVTFVRNLKK